MSDVGATGEPRTEHEEVTLRPLREGDLPGLRTSSSAALSDMRRRLGEPALPPRPSDGRTTGDAIMRHLLQLDPAGAWAAVAGGGVIGAAVAGVRERLWYLAQFHLVPGYQGRGIGRRLLQASLGHGAGAAAKLLHSSLDPQAMRTYQRAGFALEPTLQATGRVRRSAIPAVGGIRFGDSEDFDLASDVDRALRGSAHGPDLELLVRLGNRLLITDGGRRRGYALMDTSPRIVAATDEETARSLLWSALAECSADDVAVHVLRANQQWAVDVAVRAGLRLAPGGPLCTMGETGAMAPYLPHTGLL